MRILGIESSCDETAVAVLESPLVVRSSVVASQIAAHQPYGGVVPELAAREHVKAFPPVLEAAMRESGLDWPDLDGIAVTQGPGLSSSLLSGLSVARGLSQRLKLPLYPVHHLEAHMLSLYFSESRPENPCPALVMLVTGGHTAMIRMNAPGDYDVLGRSIDDAAGEALDKGARLLGLDYPGGPEIEKLALTAGGEGPVFPRGLPAGEEALSRGGDYAFSFSGLKTSLRYHLEHHADADLPAVAASYQQAVMETLMTRAEQALENEAGFACVACVGGVAKNSYLREGLEGLCEKRALPLITVPLEYCTDNAAMIAAVPLLRECGEAQADLGIDPNLVLQGLKMRGRG
ncbi:tRNA (adenosine(37)-N6)-threonylcarbamoyltransferase complex transferase subunit TsaD [Kiritimatiellaeota bacterium B1221]|nr:tRNA (adenosine(37)-N6)-threonylcarbamoyltransferase complex transferase subunit TsaD [Kiritimatiellaeota bacterium B1221]